MPEWRRQRCLFPKFSLMGSFGGAGTVGESRGLALGFSRLFSFGPAISLPIFDGGRLRANVKIQEARQQQTAIRYHQVVLQFLEDVENALVACAREQERQQDLAAATEAGREFVDLANQLYTSGRFPLCARRAEIPLLFGRPTGAKPVQCCRKFD